MLLGVTAAQKALNLLVLVRIQGEQLWRVARVGPQAVSKTVPVARLRVRLLHFPLGRCGPWGPPPLLREFSFTAGGSTPPSSALGVRRWCAREAVTLSSSGMVGSTPTALTVLDHLEWGPPAKRPIRFESGRASGPVKVTGWSCKPAQEGSIPSGSTGM